MLLGMTLVQQGAGKAGYDRARGKPASTPLAPASAWTFASTTRRRGMSRTPGEIVGFERDDHASAPTFGRIVKNTSAQLQCKINRKMLKYST